MLTRSGWLTAAGAVGLLCSGRLFGLGEAYIAGATLGALVVLSAVGVALVRLRLDVARDLHPARVHAGGSSSVVLEVRNRGRRRTPVLTFVDRVSGNRVARLSLPPLEREATTGATYDLPTDRRGILEVGPLEVAVSDPFGLAESRIRVAGVSELTVYPAVDEVAPVPMASGNDPHAGRDNDHRISPGGDEFYALREYVVGDDLRRVHWASTARHDHLMVRQDELPWQGRATLFLDTRAGHRPNDAIEPPVRAAASLVRAARRGDQQIRLVTPDGTDSGFADSHAQVEAIMEKLAVVTPSGMRDLARATDRLTRTAGGTLVLLLPAEISREDVFRLLHLRIRYGRIIPVLFHPSTWGAGGQVPDHHVRGAVRATRAEPFPVAWDALVKERSGRSRQAAAAPWTTSATPGLAGG